MDPGHKARKNPSDNADLGFQAVGPALRIMQLNVEGLSAAKRRAYEKKKMEPTTYAYVLGAAERNNERLLKSLIKQLILDVSV